jgi:PKD domain-containing protein/K319-like protein
MRKGMEPVRHPRRLAPALLAAAAVLALVPAGAAAACSTNFAPGFGTNAVCAATSLAVTPNPVDPGAVATFDGSGSTGDAEHAIATYEWSFGDGVVETTAAPSDSTTHAYTARGHYVATLTTLDSGDVPIATSTPIDVYVSAMPVAAFSVPGGTLRPGVAYGFDASASTAPGGSIAHYLWDWGDGTSSDTTTPVVQHTFAAGGASSGVTLTVVNDVGLASAPVTHAIGVANQLPVVQVAATPSTVDVGEALTLSAAGSVDPDGSIVEYRWDLDANGSFETSTGTTPSVGAGGYPNAGLITLRVKVIDDSGQSSVGSVNVTVVDPTGSTGVGGGPTGGGGGGTGSTTTTSGGSAGSGTGGSASGDSGAGAGGGGTAGNAFALGLSGPAIQRLATVLRRGIALQARANRTATGTLTLTISGRDAHVLHLASRRTKKPVAIGTARIRLRAGHAAKATIKLSRKAATALRRSLPRSLRITVTGTLTTGTTRTTAQRLILLRR